ncbi:MAG: Type IV secretory pathway VirB4 component-like protein [Candidatus Peregrinibacteria bacterium GW2011_GWA2_47_7]|nr:MAG: Type IV secretory pathway VirB4 component-like protein [Candidatus Peregrinibacteria bacterium GW2011_GWA2_47_7]
MEAHVAANKAKSDKTKAGEQAGKAITETMAGGEKLTSQERQEILNAEKVFQEGLASIRDLIAPSSMDINYDGLKLSGMYAKSMFVFTYPRYLDTNWMSPLVNFDATMYISQFVYPIDSAAIMRTLRRKVAQMQSAMRMDLEKGNVRDPAIETALQDAEQLRTELQRGQEKFFQFAMYITLYAKTEKGLKKVVKQIESLLGGKLILTRGTELQAEQAFNTTLPMCLDELEVIRNMNTSPLSSTFPFTTSSLTSNDGILYGLNRHNDSLIIFDRFSLENANSVVFAKSGAGKSYAVKLEVLRSMMVGTDVIIIDPENEYENLTRTVGGTYLRVSLTSDRRINPFDLPKPLQGEEVQPGDLLRSNIISLQGLLKVMMGQMSPLEDSLLDKALNDVYAIKGITMDILDPSDKTPPTMEDLESVLNSMEGAQSLAQRLQKFTTGTYGGIFNKPTNVNLENGLMVFCIRDLEDALRPIAMYIILNYIWTHVRAELKKRILVIDEAWSLMQHEDSAKFLYGLVKRARKYYLGVTTITQDVEDFVNSELGKPIITNSSLQLLLKQAPSAIDPLTKIFNLTEGEKYMLLNSGVGQGLFFAGLKHVAIQIIASYGEDKLVTTNPEEILAKQKEETKF